MQPDGGPVLVTGATGGVGSIAVKLLAHLGYEVHAVTGKTSSHDFLRSLGAREILSREDALQGAERPLLKPRWGGRRRHRRRSHPVQCDQVVALRRQPSRLRPGGFA